MCDMSFMLRLPAMPGAGCSLPFWASAPVELSASERIANSVVVVFMPDSLGGAVLPPAERSARRRDDHLVLEILVEEVEHVDQHLPRIRRAHHVEVLVGIRLVADHLVQALHSLAKSSIWDDSGKCPSPQT